ncbi:FtsK/SpoIIIE domain-containing protein [Streptomyces sodiiphilus]|uniref:FtsK/SpoIIIE domain-containing protein n=1 Tax=Streptomyces sodiiphilus TaxID=226217 RepID=A0ABN2NWI3_9ACTN
MRLSLTVVDPQRGIHADAVLDADPATPVGDIVPELTALLGSRFTPRHAASTAGLPGPDAAAPSVFVDGVQVDPAVSLGSSPLREGVVVSLYRADGCPPGEPHGFVELRVAGGPGAGAVHRLGVGRVDIGSGNQVRVRIADPALAPRALTLRVRADGTCTVTVHGGTTVLIDGEGSEDAESSEEPVDWPLGAQAAIGDSLLELAPYSPPDAALRPSEDGAGLDYNRPPRLVPPKHPTHFRLPKEPEEPDKRPVPWIMAFLPLVGAVTMALLLNRWIFLIMAVLTPIMLFSNYFLSKKRGREKYADKLKAYRETKDRIEKDARDALAVERFTRRHAAPDPGTVLNAATGPRTRLWERRRTDEDHLLLRVGTCSIDSEVELTDPEQDDHKRKVLWKVPDAPVTIPLQRHGVVGFAAPGDMARALGRWAVAQLAVLHSPNDVQVCVLTDAGGQESWEWLRWLPHVRPTSEQDTNIMIGTDAETVAARLAELTVILDSRLDAVKKARSRGVEFTEPDVVIVFDGSRRMRTLPGVIRLLKEGPAVSVYSLCLDHEERFLPGECQAVAVAESVADTGSGSWRQFRPGFAPAELTAFGAPSAGAPGPGAAGPGHGDIAAAGSCPRLRVEQRDTDPLRGVLPDLVTPVWCGLVSRSVSALRDISGEAEAMGIPVASRLLDVLDLEPPTAAAVMARWRQAERSTTVVLGESYDGPFSVDLRRDGPHGLIAGTTGSGKSELLQTIVASLAVANTPENMTFVLIDYKGGSAFKDCVQLPHTVGMVTDLDNHLVERALRSLGAELTRREHVLAAVGAKDIEDYQDLHGREPGRHHPMPRLLIVIDEFASLARELPDFVKGLVNIAQRGRSLGIHLLLATQRPSGVVSPEIRANTNLRIALRVTDTGESNDVLDAPDASLITKATPGRAYVRLGAASLVPFQSGRVGGHRPGTVDPAVSRPWAGLLGWKELGRAEVKRPAGTQREDDDNTDLRVLVDSVIRAVGELGLPAQPSPWLPPLPELVLLADLPVPQAAGALPPAPFGVEDVPDQQARRPLAVDFAAFGHLLVAGAPRTGRSQLLRTLAGSLARTHSSDDLHLYGFDCGNGALNILTRLPHCGAVVGRNQVDRAKRLLKRLSDEIGRRQELLSRDTLADIGEQRAGAPPGERLPHIVVLVDRWEGWTPTLGEIDNGALTDEMFFIMREGVSVGVHVVVTGDQRVMTGRISSLSEDKFTFRLQDRTDYAAAGLRARELPEEIGPGRMFRAQSGSEVQIAVLGPELTGQGQAAALAGIADEARERDAGVPRSRRPFRVDVLPANLTFEDAWEMRDPETSGSALWSLVGVGGDELTAYGPDMATGIRSFVVAGPAKSGRSTVLMHMARSFLRNGVRLVVSTPRVSPLRELEGETGVLHLLTGTKLTNEQVAEALGTASPDDPIVFLMDDAEDLRRCKEADDELRAVVIRGAERGVSVVIGGDAADVCSGFSGWQSEVKKARRGVLLSPQTHRHGELIGAKLARSVAVERPQPGNGILHLGDGRPMTVKLPVPP